ncbi:MAG: zinc ribbon domain-containing protein [Euryarchaeota archaeon]|nr:zinc ribbon domain-containing protein [Euryarchaeota archaeon]
MPDLASLASSLALQVDTIAFGLGGLLCAFIIAWFVIWILVAIWVYKDAESRGMGGVLWLIVVLVAGIIGLIIYLVVRGSHPVRPPGYPAGYPYPPPYPGYGPAYPPPAAPPAQPAAAPGSTTCRNCGNPVAAGSKFCARCGAAQ